MHREMLGRLEMFKEKTILVTKIGAVYEVVPDTIVAFTESNVRIKMVDLQPEHYGKHVRAVVETES